MAVRTGEELDVENVHALVLPWRGVLTTARTGPSEIEEGENVAQDGIQGGGEEDGILNGSDNGTMSKMRC